MSISIKTLKKSDPSALESLKLIFNPTNTISCAAYGSKGDHCNDERTEKKFELWGAKGEIKNNPLRCYLIFKNNDPAGMINLGVTGNKPTVIDRNHHNGQVLELSGLMVRDKYLAQKGNKYVVDKEVVSGVVEALDGHKASGYTKAFATYQDHHPYQAGVYKQSGAIKLTPKVAEEMLGTNALHPERFKFEKNQLQECFKWDSSADAVPHDGWHSSPPCIEWSPVNGVLFNIEAGDISTSTDEL